MCDPFFASYTAWRALYGGSEEQWVFRQMGLPERITLIGPLDVGVGFENVLNSLFACHALRRESLI